MGLQILLHVYIMYLLNIAYTRSLNMTAREVSHKKMTKHEGGNQSGLQLTPQNINGQDWKYTLFVILICHSQNIRRHSAIGGD